MELKIKSMLGVAMMAAVALATVSCSDDDNNNDESIYSDRSYGQQAISACNDLVEGLEDAQEEIASAQLSAQQEAYLKDVLANFVDNVVIPTYKSLADNTEALENELKGLNVNTITQADINKACASFKEARKYWEQSEAFLGGAASDFDIDPTIDSWPLNRSLLLNYFNSGTMDEDMLDDASILGFHALEFILFRNGQPRKVEELQNNDTYVNFSGVSGAKELLYAQQVCKLLKERTYQLQVAWEGQTTANAARVAVVEEAGLDYTTEKGLSYGENIKKAGEANSTFATLTDAIAQVLSDEEGSAAAIATEVGSAKIANPFAAGYIFYVESPYSQNSIADFQDNIRSVRNVWYGTTSGSRNSNTKSFYNFFASIRNSNTASEVETLFNNAIAKIGGMPAPFVKYCSTVWNIAFEDSEVVEIEDEE